MVDQLSSGMIGNGCHIYPTRIQCGYLQRYSARLGAASTWRRQGAESGEEGIYYNEGWRFCHYDTIERRGLSAEINGGRTAGQFINDNREGFSSCSACSFLAPFSSVFHNPELGRPLKSNNLGNGQYVLLCGWLTPSTSSIYSYRVNFTVGVG